jgi:predicted dehydrogenase
LSPKPFVLVLNKGKKFAELAEKMGVILAVNQNGRLSSHWSWGRNAIVKNKIGKVDAVHMNCHWSHDWVADSRFNRVHHIVLYDYAIHWFEALASFMPDNKPLHVTANLSYATVQHAAPPLLGQVLVEFEHGHASLVFDGATQCGHKDDGYIVGSKGACNMTAPRFLSIKSS